MTLSIAFRQFSTNEVFENSFFFKIFLFQFLTPRKYTDSFLFCSASVCRSTTPGPRYVTIFSSRPFLCGNARDNKIGKSQNVSNSLANIGFWDNHGILRDKMTGGQECGKIGARGYGRFGRNIKCYPCWIFLFEHPFFRITGWQCTFAKRGEIQGSNLTELIRL